MMESILDSLTADRLYPAGGTNLLDLEELTDGDFLTNVVSGRRLFKPLFYTCESSVSLMFIQRQASPVRLAIPTNQTHLRWPFRPEPDLRRAVQVWTGPD